MPTTATVRTSQSRPPTATTQIWSVRRRPARSGPSRLLLNKIDRVSEADRAALRAKHPDAILLSANSPEDAATLRETIIAFFEDAMVEDELVLPYAIREAGISQRRV